MISFEIFMMGLLVISTITGLATEATKKILAEHNVSYKANTLAGIVAVLISTLTGIAYVVCKNSAFTSQIVVCIIAMIFMSWLCAMIGYDKVVQAISQFKTDRKDDEE